MGTEQLFPLTTTQMPAATPPEVRWRSIAALALLAGLLACPAAPADACPGITERVSVDSAGNQGNGGSGPSSISATGRFVAFGSFASNLVPGDTNGFADVFVHDRQTGATERVSVSSGRTQGNRRSVNSSLSADGRLVAFASEASNLVRRDTNGVLDVFVHDRGNPAEAVEDEVDDD